MYELLMKVAGMRLKSIFSAKVFVLTSIGNELVTSYNHTRQFRLVSRRLLVSIRAQHQQCYIPGELCKYSILPCTIFFFR